MSQDAASLVKDFFMRYPSRHIQKGEILLLPDSPVTSIFYLASGHMIMYDITEEGSQIILNAFKPGAFFPMSGALNKTKNLYFIEANVDCTIHQAPSKDAVDFLHDHPAVTFDLLQRVYRGTDGILKRMSLLMSGDAKARLAFELLNAGHRFGTSNINQAITIPLTEIEIAKRSGLSRETVSRLLQPLKDDGIVSIKNKQITIHNEHAIKQIIQAD